MPIQDLVVQRILDDSLLNLKCSHHFLLRFLSRVGLSFRLARPTRQAVISDAECVHFLGQLTAAYYRYPPHLILNFDELYWYLAMAGDKAAAERGADSVQNHVNRDAKANFHSSPRSSQKARGSRSS
jgi:hypothetical protein